MTEKMDALLNNARTRLTKLYPDETLSRAMFSIMEVIEELAKNSNEDHVHGISNGLGQWMEGVDFRAKEFHDKLGSISEQISNMSHYWTQVCENLNARITETNITRVSKDINDLRDELAAGLRTLANDVE